MRSVWVLQAMALLTLLPIDLCNGRSCPPGKFGWQCRYDCLCDGPCDTITGECDNCTGLSWGTGCLLNSSCTYNDDDGTHYQGKRGFGDLGARCITWDPAVTGYPADRFPDADLRKAGGYCRNPADPEPRPWCYTSQERYYEWCTISPCPCPSGRFGVNCASECHCSDDENTCDSGTGLCQHGCHPNFQGSSCQECRGRTFGDFCEPCHCRDPNEVCNQTTGYCQSGCPAGFTGDSCDIACKSGLYGLNCSGTCSDHCGNPGVCNRVTGNCDCQAGYQPPTCHKENRSGLQNEAIIIASTFGALSALLLLLLVVLLVMKLRRRSPPISDSTGEEGNSNPSLSAWRTTESEHETQMTAPHMNVSDASGPGPIYI